MAELPSNVGEGRDEAERGSLSRFLGSRNVAVDTRVSVIARCTQRSTQRYTLVFVGPASTLPLHHFSKWYRGMVVQGT